MRLAFSTIDYQRAHGKLPRGRGSWAFCPAADYDKPNYLDHVMWASGGLTFAAARKQATAYYLTTAAGQAALRGKAPIITVCT